MEDRRGSRMLFCFALSSSRSCLRAHWRPQQERADSETEVANSYTFNTASAMRNYFLRCEIIGSSLSGRYRCDCMWYITCGRSCPLFKVARDATKGCYMRAQPVLSAIMRVLMVTSM